MRRILAGVAALALGVAVWAAALPAKALSSFNASLCVSETQFVFDVTVEDVESSELLVEFLNANFGFIEWITATITVNQTTGAVSFDIGPSIMVSNVAAIDSWALPFTDLSLSSSPGTVGWDVSFSGAVGHGTQPYSPGDTLPNAFARDALEPPSDSRIFDVPITDCSAGSTTTTSSTTTSTTASTTTSTTASTTTSTTTASTTTSTTASTTTSTTASTTTTVASTTTTDIAGASTLPLTGSSGADMGDTATVLIVGGALILLLVSFNRRFTQE